MDRIQEILFASSYWNTMYQYVSTLYTHTARTHARTHIDHNVNVSIEVFIRERVQTNAERSTMKFSYTRIRLIIFAF